MPKSECWVSSDLLLSGVGASMLVSVFSGSHSVFIARSFHYCWFQRRPVRCVEPKPSISLPRSTAALSLVLSKTYSCPPASRLVLRYQCSLVFLWSISAQHSADAPKAVTVSRSAEDLYGVRQPSARCSTGRCSRMGGGCREHDGRHRRIELQPAVGSS